MPMLLAGDEMGHAQEGNNNGCCQDSPLLRVNWELSKDQCELLAFARQLIRLSELMWTSVKSRTNHSSICRRLM